VTDRLTEHATRCVIIGRIYIRSTATGQTDNGPIAYNIAQKPQTDSAKKKNLQQFTVCGKIIDIKIYKKENNLPKIMLTEYEDKYN